MKNWRIRSLLASALVSVLALAAPPPAHAAIGEGSCVGDQACFQGPDNVGTNACVGAQSCLQGPEEVGDSSCLGESVCSQASGTIGDDSCSGESGCRQGTHDIGNHSCHGYFACWQTYTLDPDPVRDGECGFDFPCGTVGNGSCNGSNACPHLHANVGNYSCNGPDACSNRKTSVGDCESNTVFVAECNPPVCGDVNKSGTITSGDALTILRLAVGQDVSYSCPICGDGELLPGEECEAGNLGGNTCESLGFGGGTLSCAAGCSFDKSKCYGARFTSSGATIVDHQTGLEWEKKTGSDAEANAADPHDADNVYSWCAGFDGACDNPKLPFDGTAATDFLASLNGASAGGCYAGHCDWRLPTLEELQTIVLPDASCDAAPCVIDPVFLPSTSSSYWTSTSYDPALLNGYAYTLRLNDGNVDSSIKDYSLSVRAVRAK